MPIIELKNLAEKELIPGYKVRFVHTDNATFAFWDIKSGSVLPEHSHIHEQVSQVTEGEFELSIRGTPYLLKPGQVAIILPNEEHSGKALTDCKITDTFYPLREDYMM